MSKFSNPFSLKNPINQIVKAKLHKQKPALPKPKGEKFKGVNMNDDSPMSKLGCGGEGCVRKRGNEWVILNNKKAGYPVWRSGFKSEADAKKMLSAYHANS